MVPGSLPVSHRWAPLLAAVILSPLMGLFYHQVSANMVCFSVIKDCGSLDAHRVPGFWATSWCLIWYWLLKPSMGACVLAPVVCLSQLVVLSLV